MTRLAHRSTWAALHRRWTRSWDHLGPYRGPCFLGHPDARHRTADALLGMWFAGEPIDVVADEFGVDILTTVLVVAAGVNAERARVAARMPRGREPPAGYAPTSTTSTT